MTRATTAIATDIWNEAAYEALAETAWEAMDLGNLAEYEPKGDIYQMLDPDEIERHARATVLSFLDAQEAKKPR